MLSKHQWLWTVYFLLILLFTVKEGYDLFAPDSQAALYYLIVRAFDSKFNFDYGAHIGRLILNIIHCLPLLLYAYRIRFLPPRFWQGLFALRCLFEISGHSYEMNSLAALRHIGLGYLITALAIMSIPYIPSYIACYWYAFRQEKIFGKN